VGTELEANLKMQEVVATVGYQVYCDLRNAIQYRKNVLQIRRKVCAENLISARINLNLIFRGSLNYDSDYPGTQ
jgi:hypothetical protein